MISFSLSTSLLEPLQKIKMYSTKIKCDINKEATILITIKANDLLASNISFLRPYTTIQKIKEIKGTSSLVHDQT